MYEVKAGAKKVAAKKVAAKKVAAKKVAAKKVVAKKVAAKKVAAKKGGEHFLKRFMLTDDKINNFKKGIKNPFKVDKKTGRLTTKNLHLLLI